MSQDVSQPCSNWFVFLPNEWKCYLAKWVWGTNCTYHQKSSLENTFQTYAWGNEPVSLPVCHSTLCYSGCVSQAGIAFLMLSLLACSESGSAQSQAAFVRSPCHPQPGLKLSCSSVLPSPISSHAFFQRDGRVLAAEKGTGTTPALLSPSQKQQQQTHSGVIHHKCIQKRGVRCLESSAFCLWNLWELLMHYISFLNSLQIVFSPPLEIFVTVDYFALCCCM